MNLSKNVFLKLSLIVALFLPNILLAQDLPPTNSKVVEFCTNAMGKKIDRGECWDLAKFALDYADAVWESPFDYGEILDLEADIVIAGDIIQFEKVELSNGTTYPHHTAVVMEVLENGNYLMAHQNFNNIKKVNTRELDLSLLSKGSITFYRPR